MLTKRFSGNIDRQAELVARRERRQGRKSPEEEAELFDWLASEDPRFRELINELGKQAEEGRL